MIETTTFVPRHLGLILDGNRRWARAEGLSLFEGHRKGYGNLKEVARAAFDRGVEFVSAYVFSTENWNRSKEEVKYLAKLLLWLLRHEMEILHQEGRRIRVLGVEAGLSKTLLKAIQTIEQGTKQNARGTLLLCLNYGGQQEIADAFRRILSSGQHQRVVTPELISEFLYAPEVPPIDLVIRTSGEQRLSNFMLWRSAYSELLFVAKHWPDFGPADLEEALQWYAGRQRRFGV